VLLPLWLPQLWMLLSRWGMIGNRKLPDDPYPDADELSCAKSILSVSLSTSEAPRRFGAFGFRSRFSDISRSIGKALSHDAFDGAFGALYTIDAEPNAIGIAEVKFAQIAVQMLLGVTRRFHRPMPPA